MASSTHKFQAPKGMRDFYPADMAVRRYIEGVWRQVSINHGFEEIDGPTFEHLELYTHKSGPGIVSELFQAFSGKDKAEIAQIRSGKDAPYALRPEFTPTLARMVAARAGALPQPIKWFAIPSHFRAERPQRGRLREFFQWNVDFIGDESTVSDVEILSCCVRAFERFGLHPDDIQVRYSDREVLQAMLERIGISAESANDWMVWIDKYDRLDSLDRIRAAKEFGGTEEQARKVQLLWSGADPQQHENAANHARNLGMDDMIERIEEEAQRTVAERLRPSQRRMNEFEMRLAASGLREWCIFDPKIVRGLAYYTGLVFEVHEVSSADRAVAGGGRYDKLIESFGGPSMPACGFGMGDVVLGLLLHEKGLLPEETYMQPYRPHAFVISNGDDVAEAELPKLVAQLRRAGYHVRHTYRTTRNIGKLLSEAGKCRARTAIILDAKLSENLIGIKDLESGDQDDKVPRDQIASALRKVLAGHHDAAM